MSFKSSEIFPGVFHIEDALGVCMTLLVGEDRALLVDAGYGVEDVRGFVETLTERPVTLLLTHAHHDHALGARWFSGALLSAGDIPLIPRYTGRQQRERVLSQARFRGLQPAGDFMADSLPPLFPLGREPVDLGGLTAVPLPCPGHTPGSAAVYVPERRLLLTGDAWNPCTWLFFPEALPVGEALGNLRRLLELPFDTVLCPHSFTPHPRAKLRQFLDGLTEDALRAAPPVDIPPYEKIDTRRAVLPDGQELIFDGGKAGL